MTRTDTGSQSLKRYCFDTCFLRRVVGMRRLLFSVSGTYSAVAEYLSGKALAGKLRASSETEIVHDLFDPLSIREHIGPGALLLRCRGAEDVYFT